MARFGRKLPSRLRRKRRIAFVRDSFFFLVMLAGICVFFVMLLREPAFRVSSIEVAGAETVPEEEILGIVAKELAGSYASVVPRESIFLYPRRRIEGNLAAAISRLASAEVSMKDFRTIEVTVRERIPSYLWCGENPESPRAECLFTDETGYLFGRAVLSGDLYARLYGEFIGNGEPERSRFLPEAEFAELHSFIGSVRVLGLASSSLRKKGDGDYELYLAAGGKILFNLEGGAERLASNLESALSAEPLKSQMRTKRASLEYLDLRFGNKVFFKFR